MLEFKGQWGWPTVSVAGVIGMLAGVLACTVESISYYPTTAKMCGMYIHKIIYSCLLLPALCNCVMGYKKKRVVSYIAWVR